MLREPKTRRTAASVPLLIEGRYSAGGRRADGASARAPENPENFHPAGVPRDFVLRLQFRAAVNADSGIYVRGPPLQGRDFLVAGPDKELKKYRPQDWDEIEVVVKEGVARCPCNGDVLEEALKLPPTGPISLEGDRDRMEYLHIRIKELPARGLGSCVFMGFLLLVGKPVSEKSGQAQPDHFGSPSSDELTRPLESSEHFTRTAVGSFQPMMTCSDILPRPSSAHRGAWWWVGVAILLGVVTVRGSDQPAEGDNAAPTPTVDDLLQAGQRLWDEYAPPEIKAHYEFPTPEAAEEFLAALQHALAEGSFADIAAYDFDARQALVVLRQFQGGDELADWLEPRLDFITASGAPGATPSATVPAPTNVPSPLAQPYWDRVVVGRQPPARAGALVPRLKEIFTAEGVPPEWVWIAEVESSMNPQARSPAGARGLFQFMPATAKRFGMSVSWPDERTDPEKSARAAAQYLRLLHDNFGTWPLALAAYNAGEGRVRRALKSAGADSFPAIARQLPAETRLYVPKVMATVAMRESIQDPAALSAP